MLKDGGNNLGLLVGIASIEGYIKNVDVKKLIIKQHYIYFLSLF